MVSSKEKTGVPTRVGAAYPMSCHRPNLKDDADSVPVRFSVTISVTRTEYATKPSRLSAVISVRPPKDV
jgi:hypothetical protein